MQFADDGTFLYGQLGTSRAIRKGYWFPHQCKYLAWFVVIVVIMVCSVFLVLYGLTFGLIKCYLWMTAVMLSITIGLTVIQPARIFVMSYFLALIMKSPPSLQFKKIPEKILTNEYDERRAFIVQQRRLDNTPFYTPTPKYKLQNRAEHIKYHLEQRKLFIDVMMFGVFAAVLTYIVVSHKSWAGYYSTEVVKHLTVYGSYTNTISFGEVTTYKQFLEYLNMTLFPSLYGAANTNSRVPTQLRSGSSARSESTGGDSKFKRSSDAVLEELSNELPHWDEEISFGNGERFSRDEESQKNVSEVYERSWTLDPSLKMIGIPRMRQLRVKTNTCAGIKQIKPREKECMADFSFANQETGNFGLFWRPYGEESLTPKEQKPWMYQSGWKTGGVHLIGEFSSYPAGGYILEFSKNLDDSRMILNFMDTFQWIDTRTRAIIIEFTLYSVNVNLFNVVHLIAERSASGYFIMSHQIDTAKFMFLASELEIISIIMIVAFDALILLLLYRQAIRIERTSFKSYLTEGNPTIDILIITLGSLSVIFIFLKTHYVASLLDTLDRSQNYEYVSFSYAALWDDISTFINATLVILSSVKLFQLLQFRVVFLQFQETLRGCGRYFMALGVQLLVTLIAFAFFFHLVLMSYDHDFSTFGRALSVLIGKALGLDRDYDRSIFENTPWFVAPLFYFLFVIFMTFLIMSFFVSVICFYLTRVKSTQIQNKYNAISYLKFLLTASSKSDIMRLRGGSSSRDGRKDSPLRLRGGGAACGRICWGKREEFPPKYMADNELIQRGQPAFTTAKVYEFVQSYQLDDLYRFEAMKRITRAALQTDLSEKERDRELAMKVLVARRLNPPESKLPEKYYAVVQGQDRSLVSTGRLIEMRKIVDNYGKEKLIEKYRNAGINLKVIEDEVEDFSEIYRRLNRKFSLLEVVARERYREERKRKRNLSKMKEERETE